MLLDGLFAGDLFAERQLVETLLFEVVLQARIELRKLVLGSVEAVNPFVFILVVTLTFCHVVVGVSHHVLHHGREVIRLQRLLVVDHCRVVSRQLVGQLIGALLPVVVERRIACSVRVMMFVIIFIRRPLVRRAPVVVVHHHRLLGPLDHHLGFLKQVVEPALEIRLLVLNVDAVLEQLVGVDRRIEQM